MDGWISEMWALYKVEFDSAINKNEVMLFIGK
jgi:hypothetical protein